MRFRKAKWGSAARPFRRSKTWRALFRGIPLGDVTVSMTINSPAAVLWAMYLAVAEQQGVDWKAVSGTLQNDILKEYIAQKEYIFPPRPSMRLVTDTIEFGARHTPRFNPISISGYHIREAGSTAVQELAFTLRDGMEYVEWALERGMQVDEFAPRLSFFFNAHNDFFEEIAKYRAARKLWAYAMRDRFGAKDERSLKLRFHSQTAGCSLTWQQPYNNVVRTAIQALAAVLGGTQSLHTNSLDEAYALPSEQAVTIALRTQQILGIRERRNEHARSAGRQLLRGAADARHGAGRRGLLPAHRRDGRDDRGHRERLPAERDRQRQLRVSARGGGEGEAGGGGERVPVGRPAHRAAADRPDGGRAPGEEAGGVARAAR
jgi:methylmalonyl-CoA mutase N-terminal domain/subunit